MNIKFVGTGSGKTSLKRFHSSIIISGDNSSTLIDCGDGISKALLYQGIKFNELGNIIISHFHPDHYSGLTSLLVNMYLSNRQSPLKIFVYKEFNDFVSNLITYSHLSNVAKKFQINIVPFEFNEKIKLDNNLNLRAKRNSHLIDKSEVENLDISYSSSFLIEHNSLKLLYTSDIGCSDDLYLFSNTGINILITEATHIDFNDIIGFVREKNIKKVFITHIDDEDENKLKEIIRESDLEKSFTMAYDGLNFDFR